MVYISYSNKDQETAFGIRKYLSSKGVDCWDELMLLAGDLSGGIKNAISLCSVFLLLVSEASQISHRVTTEFMYAAALEKPIILLQIDNSPVRLNDLSDYPILIYAGHERETLKHLLKLLKEEIQTSNRPRIWWNSTIRTPLSDKVFDNNNVAGHKSTGNISRPNNPVSCLPEEKSSQNEEPGLISESQDSEPYKGENSYVFLSYSHMDIEAAMDIVRHLQSKGFRVWYDEGIDPGSEWDENIASHVEKCGYFIALLSRNYLNSSNCKDELNFARDKEKPRLLIYLEYIQLPPGMQMRLSRLQAIHRYKYKEQKIFYKKLYSAKGISVCRTSDHTEG